MLTNETVFNGTKVKDHVTFFLEVELSYFICVFLGMRPLSSCQIIWPSDLGSNLWPTCLWTLTFAIMYNVWTNRDSAFIFYMCSPCDETFPFIPIYIWPCDFNHDLWPTFLKRLTFTITFEPLEVGLSYFAYRYLVMRHFHSNQIFDPQTLTMTPWPLT